jgi:hypothetical protein
MYKIFILGAIVLIGCGERADYNMQCDNNGNSYRKCTPMAVRELLQECKKHNMTYSKMVYTENQELASMSCNPMETIDGKKYWDTIK